MDHHIYSHSVLIYYNLSLALIFRNLGTRNSVSSSGQARMALNGWRCL